MKNFKTFSTAAAFALTVFVLQGCSFSTANMSSFKTFKDKEGKSETAGYKGGETIFAQALVANNPGKVKVKFSLTDPKGQPINGADVSLDIDGDRSANYSLPVPPSVAPGNYKLNAEMLNEAGEKKDSKSAAITLEPGAAPAAPNDDDDK